MRYLMNFLIESPLSPKFDPSECETLAKVGKNMPESIQHRNKYISSFREDLMVQANSYTIQYFLVQMGLKNLSRSSQMNRIHSLPIMIVIIASAKSIATRICQH